MWPIVLSLALRANEVQSEIASDEVVVFYPTYAHRTTDEKSWVLHIHGRIFEPEENSLKRAALIGMMRRSLNLSKKDVETDTFRQRMRAFLVDNERNKTIHIRLGDNVFRAGKSGPNGHFSSDLVLSNDQVDGLQTGAQGEHRTGSVRFHAIVPADDSREFVGEVRLIEPRGLSVISDVDDTIKISDVRNRRALLANTFLREFRTVAGMPSLYQQWERLGVQFHYVSASPWQLYRPLAEFIDKERFPPGSLHMKMFRLKDSSALALVTSPQKYKPEVIAKILTDFPKRRFILVGDSGERDPEIFAELAQKYPQQIARIFIREVGADDKSELRYKTAFKDMPHGQWQVFTDPAELSGAVTAELVEQSGQRSID
jgi:hypothetical protein